MKTISQRELRNDSGEIMRGLARGESYRVTSRGDQVGVLLPSTHSAVDELTLREGTQEMSFPEGVRATERTEEVLTEVSPRHSVIVVDTSALAKLLVTEEQSAALRGLLTRRRSEGEEFAISTIAVTELRRLAIRLEIPDERIEPIVGRFRVIRLTESILQLAGRLPARHLGTLDAIHLATALAVEATALVTYDRRQAEAAEREGIVPVSPNDVDDRDTN